MRKLFIIILITFSCVITAKENTSQQSYSFKPLNNPVFDYSHVVVDVAKFNNWLNANYSKLTSNTMKGPREHLYYLLSSYISALYEKDKIILPKEKDLILQTLFFWSERLGVYGGALVYNQIKNNKAEPMSELMKIPDSFKLSLNNDQYNLKSKENIWLVNFPYYFMISNMNAFQATNGMKTQLVSISTGATKDNTKAARSQSTLMLIYSPSNEFDAFSKYWLTQFGVPLESKTNKLEVKNLKSRSNFNKTSLLHTEITFIPTTNGTYAIAYLGMDGAYQVNRQHYLDFLNSLKSTK